MTCLYIKDDGERCQRDTEPFCHQHSDSRMALLYHTLVAEKEEVTLDSGYECEDCNTRVQPIVADVSQSPVRFTMYEASYGLACECSTYEAEDGELPTRIDEIELPTGWMAE